MARAESARVAPPPCRRPAASAAAAAPLDTRHPAAPAPGGAAAPGPPADRGTPPQRRTARTGCPAAAAASPQRPGHARRGARAAGCGPPLRGPLLPLAQGAVGPLHGGFQPPVAGPPHPGAVGMRPHRPPHARVVARVTAPWASESAHPVSAPPPLARLTDGRQRRLPRPVPLGLGVHRRVPRGLQGPLAPRLGDPVRPRGHAQRPCPALALGYGDPSHRRRAVASRGPSSPARVEGVGERPLHLRTRWALSSSRALLGLHPRIRLPALACGTTHRVRFLPALPPRTGCSPHTARPSHPFAPAPFQDLPRAAG